MNTDTALATVDRGAIAVADHLTVEQLVERVRLIDEVKRRVMRVDVHYGVIPGTDKETLLKPGAEKLMLTFRLVPRLEIEERSFEGGHREIVVRCYLHQGDVMGPVVGEGIGSCSTMESRYRWRQSGRACPHCHAEAIVKGKQEYGGGWLCFGKRGGCGAKFKEGDAAIESQTPGRVENPDIADVWSTVRKIAKKRALVDATLTTTGASDFFAQDLEDTPSVAEPGSTPKAAAGSGGGRPKPAAATTAHAGAELSVVGRVTSLEEREAKGKAAGKPVYFVVVTPSEGEVVEMSTFSESLYTKATAAKEEGHEVEAWYTEKSYKDKTYRNLEKLEVDDFGSGPEPSE